MEKFSAETTKTPPAASINITIHPVRATALLTVIALTLVLAYTVTVLNVTKIPPEVARFFDLNQESNLPTWFSSGLWLASSFLALGIFQKHRDKGYDNTNYWLAMVALFLLLSIDESARLHETIGATIGKELIGNSILNFTYAWALSGIIFLLTVGLAYFRFLFRLKLKFRIMVVVAATVFVTGAVIVESIGAAVEQGTLTKFPLGQSWSRMMVYEEFLEMLGVILLIHTLILILAYDNSPYNITKSPQP